MPDTESPKDGTGTGTADCYLAAFTNPPVPLPRVPGPKLAPITPTAHAEIKFVEELGVPDKDKDGRVWKVLIDGDGPYALKMFYFVDSEDLSYGAAGNLIRRLASPQFYVDFFDPFNCECRAYGRLKEEQREDVATKAHGYLLLTPTQEAEITSKAWSEPYTPDSDEVKLDGSKPWYRSEQHRHLPIRCIVKDLATDPDPFNPSHLDTMWRDLEDFHKMGILVRDSHIRNYIGGKLIDLSRAWTMPHPGFMYTDEYDSKGQRQSDPHEVRMSIIDFGIEMDWDWDEVKIPEDLTKCDFGQGEGEMEKYGVDPGRYDWRKWEEDPDAVGKFLGEELVEEELDAVAEWEQFEIGGE